MWVFRAIISHCACVQLILEICIPSLSLLEMFLNFIL